MRMNNLLFCIKSAELREAKYVGIMVKTPASIEVIIIQHENFSSKAAYYEAAYTDNLSLKSNREVQIIGFTYGDSFEDIEKDLM